MVMYWSPAAAGFFDPNEHPQLPPDSVALSDDQYQALLTAQETGKVIVSGSGGVPVAEVPTPPAPTPDQVLAQHIALGIAITSTGTSSISGTYALDQTTMDQIGSVARDDASGLGLPGGGSTFMYPDLTGSPKSLTGAQVQALYKAQRDMVFALSTQAAVMKMGGSAVWPDQSATIA